MLHTNLSLGLPVPTVFLSEGQNEDVWHMTHSTAQKETKFMGRTQTRVTSPVSRNWRWHWTLCAPFCVEGMHTWCCPQEAEPAFPFRHRIYWSTAQPRLVPCPPWAAAASRVFSSGLSCSMVSTTGNSRARSLPGFSRMNCSSTFFRYSRLAADFSRSWFRSSRLTSLFRSWLSEKWGERS